MRPNRRDGPASGCGKHADRHARERCDYLGHWSRSSRVDRTSESLEITLSIPGAVDLVRRLAAQYGSEGVAVGAGTVLDGHAAYECIRAGATFLVSPQLNSWMIRVASRYQGPTISGAFTPTEILESAEAAAGRGPALPARDPGQ